MEIFLWTALTLMFIPMAVAPWIEYVLNPKWYVALAVLVFNFVQLLAFLAVGTQLQEIVYFSSP